MDIEKTYVPQDFLLINYEDMEFIVNRCQFSASTTLDNIRNLKNPPPYLKGIFSYNGKNILLFDYDAYLQKTFRCRRLGDSQLCILMGLEDFSPALRPRIEGLLGRSHLSREFLGLAISSQAEIRKISLEEIFLTPKGLRPRLRKQGVYGCRFPREDRIQYFIDFETTVINALKGGSK